MPQVNLSNGELLKKSLRTSLIMVGTTVLWLGMLSGVVLVSTSQASDSAESKVDRSAGPGAAVGGPRGPAAVGGAKSMRRPMGAQPASGSDAPHQGDPI